MTDFNIIRQYNFPTIIRFGPGAVNEMSGHLKANGLLQPLIVTDPMVAQLGFFRKIKEDLAENKISVAVFSDIHKNPVKSDVLKGADVYKQTQRDCIIGIGGGAAMDDCLKNQSS
jgi:alcohol dehydrogenase class IV